MQNSLVIIIEELQPKQSKIQLWNLKLRNIALKKVREYNGITFYNDSKATNPEASIVAINSFNNTDVALIAGEEIKILI